MADPCLLLWVCKRRHPLLDDDSLRNDIVCLPAAYRHRKVDRGHRSAWRQRARYSLVSAPNIHDDPPAIVPAALVTVGSQQVAFATYNQFMNARNTYYWDKKRMLEAPGDYTKTKVFRFMHARDYTLKSPMLEAVKEPLENRVWFNYPGQNWDGLHSEGTIDAPNRVARVVEDGSTQLWQYDRNALAKITRAVDPLGRETFYDFAPNGMDLLRFARKTAAPTIQSAPSRGIRSIDR